MKNRVSPRYPTVLLLTALILIPAAAWAQGQGLPIPTIKIGIGEAKDAGDVSVLIQILILLTVLSLAPAILIMMTSFTRLVVVFSFLRHALGTQQMPPNQILIGLSLFLTFFIMTPVWSTVHEKALVPYQEKKISQGQALDEALKPVRQFMFKQTREKDLALFVNMAKISKPKNKEEIPTTVLLPAYMISELKTAFQIGCLLYIPFLIIDMVVSSILLSMGMMMLPPVMISLPFKALLFVLVDGWNLIVGSLVKSFY
ncbi:MAG: flagellar biosynthetic protein FliP [Deltaproteobacteria bacterium]|jgi:flagellar biosynthetic protein FliP|nr:flagellar biosynthetic protein FliP [Deltaproteobacteria bacterium]MBP1717124.1 flagellar biosynthetic protein FliP [Deltaproteobacteria bacterium]